MTRSLPGSARPPLDAEAVSRLRERLQERDYRTDAVLTRIGAAGQAGLGRNSTVAAERALAADRSPLATLTRCWLLQQPVAETALREALGDSLEDLLAGRLLTRDGDTIRAAVDVRPYASADDGADGWLVADLTPGLDHQVAPMRTDYVLGASLASATLAEMTWRAPAVRALDLGTGCGVQSLHLARHCQQVLATDLNPRALSLAALTLGLSGVRSTTGDHVRLAHGSLYEPVDAESDRDQSERGWDLVVSNPPYVMAPPAVEAERLVYREGALPGDELVRAVVAGGARRLAPGGTCQVLANWAHVRGEPWPERLAGWVEGAGCDLVVRQREVLDPAEYVDLWLTDAGLAGDPSHRARSHDWLDYLDALGVEAVGMGWISLHRTDTEHADLDLQDWPHAVQQPVGPAFGRQQRGVAAARATDVALLAGRWRLAPDVVQETTGPPGAEDPEHIVLRQQTGFRHAVLADTALAATLGACDGELQLGRIVAAVASLLQVEADALRADQLPAVRQALREGMLEPADG